MARRWVCPRCLNGVLAPDRPRRDDVRRYCLVCSAKTGRLVERRAPALERQRAEAAAAASVRTADRRARARNAERARRSFDGLDLDAEARRLWALPTLRAAHQGRELPELTVRKSATKRYSTGRAYGRRRLVVTCGGDAANAAAVLLHELAHCALPSGEHHGRLFRSTMRSAAREAWPGIDVPTDPYPYDYRAIRGVADAIRGGTP